MNFANQAAPQFAFAPGLAIGLGFLVLLIVLGLIVILGLVYLILRASTRRSPATPSTPPPGPMVASGGPGRVVTAPGQEAWDHDNVKLLAIFHFIFAGLALLGIAFLCVHYYIMHSVFTNPAMWKAQPQTMPPRQILDVFIWFYLFAGALILLGSFLNVLSGLFLLSKRHRVFSLIIGGLDCLQVPFGTALGVFTIIVLSRPSVRQLYGEVG